MRTDRFIVVELKTETTSMPFLILEKVITVDGYRTRITSRSYGTLNDALEFVKKSKETSNETNN